MVPGHYDFDGDTGAGIFEQEPSVGNAMIGLSFAFGIAELVSDRVSRIPAQLGRLADLAVTRSRQQTDTIQARVHDLPVRPR